jgi:hypothetical protein
MAFPLQNTIQGGGLLPEYPDDDEPELSQFGQHGHRLQQEPQRLRPKDKLSPRAFFGPPPFPIEMVQRFHWISPSSPTRLNCPVAVG